MADGNSGSLEPPIASSSGGFYSFRVVLSRSALVRNLPTTILVTLSIQAVNLGSGVVLARALGPASRGDLAIAMLWPVLIAGVGGLGVAEAVTYFTGRDGNGSADILNSSLAFGLIQSVVLMLAGWVMLPFLLTGKPSAVIGASLLYLWILPLYPLTLYPLGFLQGRLFLGRFNIARLCVHVLYTAILLALWAVHLVTVQGALTASLLATFCAFLVTLWLALARLNVRPQLSLPIIASLLRYGLKLHVGNVATLVVQRADLIALTMMAPAAALGNYVVATSIGLGAGLIPGAVSMLLFPVFANRVKDAVPHGLARFLLIASAVSLIAAPGLAILLPWTLPYLFGPAFATARATSTLLVLAYLIRGWSQMVIAILRGTGQPFLASTGEMIGLFVTAVLLIRLIPTYSSYGAAIAVLVGASAALVWVVFQSLRTSHLTILRMLSYWSADTGKFIRLVRRQQAAGV